MCVEAMDGELNQEFGVDFDWLPKEGANALEATSFAALKIHVNGHLATEVEDLLVKTVRSNVRASAYSLALWFAANWWRLRWEPESNDVSWKMSHNLAAAGGGYAWPDMSFNTDGQVVWVHCRPTPVGTSDPIRFLSNFDACLPASIFSRGVDNFVGAVIERVANEAKGSFHLSTLWGDVSEERRVPDLAQWRKLEAMMGFDPDEGPEELVDGLRLQAPSVGQGLVQEVAAFARGKALEVLSWLKDEGKRRAVSAELPDFDLLNRQIRDVVKCSQLPWQQGVAAARLARAKWQLGTGPLTNKTLCGLFGISEKRFNAPEPPLNLTVSAGYRDTVPGNMFRVLLNKKHPSSLRFSLGRLVGDHLITEREERILPATEAKTARQKFQRAFAQEFLCPFEELMHYFEGEYPTDDRIEEAAAHFEVSPLLVSTVLVNRGVVARDVLGD